MPPEGGRYDEEERSGKIRAMERGGGFGVRGPDGRGVFEARMDAAH
jgi:hypothetical protein